MTKIKKTNEGTEMEEKNLKKIQDDQSYPKNTTEKIIKCNKKVKYAAIIVLVIIVIVTMIVGGKLAGKEEKKEEILTTSTLEKIINVSELSTFQAVYNGIASVANEKKPEEIDFYVSYKAKVYAGINFEEVDIVMDEDAKKIKITIPDVKITEVNVDIKSLDYMFENEKADNSTVSERAYKTCIADATKESEKENAIYELAEQNAKNIMKALVKPFVEQFDSEYELVIE